MNPIWLTLRKELRNGLRDRRTLYSTVLLPFIGLPLFTLLPMGLILRQERQIQEAQSPIGVIYLQPFPELSRLLDQNPRLRLVPIEEPESAVASKAVECVLLVHTSPEGQARLSLIYDATRASSRGAADKLRLAISQLSNQLVARRLDALNLPKELLEPIRLEERNLASPQQMAGFFLGMLIGMMATLGLISGGMVMAIDASAGEKERRTLEALLASPASRNSLVLGKFLSVLAMCLISTALLILGYTLTLRYGVKAIGLDLGMDLSLRAISLRVGVYILIALIFTAGFISALELAIGIFARSYREAQSYLTPLTLLCVLPVIFIQAIPPHPSPGLFFIPLLNTMLLIRELLMGVVVNSHLLNTLASSFIYALLALRFAFRTFHQESAILR